MNLYSNVNSKISLRAYLILLIIGGLAISFGVFLYSISPTIPLSPDTAALACAADHLSSTGQFIDSRTHHISIVYEPCWTKNIYPEIQLITSLVTKIFFGDAILATSVLAILLYTLIVLICSWTVQRLFHSPSLTSIAGLLTISSLALTRSLTITPHNLYGYLIIAVIFLLLTYTPKVPFFLYMLFLWLVTGVAYILHPMSFAVLAGSLGIFSLYILIIRKQWLLASIMILGLYITVSIITHSLHPLSLMYYLQGYSVYGIVKPIWDHVALWGYIPISLAGLGIMQSIKEKQTLLTRFALIMSVCILLAVHSYTVGIRILPDRLSAYLWMPLLFFSMYGLRFLQKKLHPIWFVMCITFILSAQILHAVIFTQGNFQEITSRYIPSSNFISALNWLEEHRTDSMLVIGVSDIINQEIAYAGLYYNGNIIPYPWYKMNIKNIQDLSSKDAYFKIILADTSHEQYNVLTGMFYTITQPNSTQSNNFVKKYGITHVLLWKRGPAFPLWQYQSESYTVVYENEEYIIYSL